MTLVRFCKSVADRDDNGVDVGNNEIIFERLSRKFWRKCKHGAINEDGDEDSNKDEVEVEDDDDEEDDKESG